MPPNQAPAQRLILALDGMESGQAIALAQSIPGLCWVKVGLELFVAGGPAVVQQLRDQGQRVFLDLKFHDIPATMAGACRSAARPPAGRSSLLRATPCARERADPATRKKGLAGLGALPPCLLGQQHTRYAMWR